MLSELTRSSEVQRVAEWQNKTATFYFLSQFLTQEASLQDRGHVQIRKQLVVKHHSSAV